MHKDIYTTGQKLPKRDKLGIHALIEHLCAETLALAVEAAFTPNTQKIPALKKLRIKIEVLKHLTRTEHELGIITEKTYLHISQQLIEISKMTNGWITYTQTGVRRGGLL